jgi:hypothetical protein
MPAGFTSPSTRAPRTPGIPGILWLLLSVGACGEPPVLEVGRIGYSAEELGALGEGQRRDLAVLTAFGLATADQRLGDVARPLVQRDLRSLLLQRGALEIGAAMAGLDEAALRARYEADPRYELTVRHLVILAERWRPEEVRDSARRRAEEALERARAGEDFVALVGAYSGEAGAAERGGLLQPGREGSWVPEFWRAARSLEEGELSGVVETEYGFHVIRLESREPVPFEEARDQVLEQSVGLSDALARSARWIEERTRGARVDTPAIVAWQDGEDPSRPLVRWPESGPDPYWPHDLDDYVLTLPPENAAALRAGPPAQAAGTVESAARNNVLLEHARSLGIQPTTAQRAAVERRWVERLDGWARDLGFAPGQSNARVKAAALAGLDPHGQDALLARVEVLRLAPVLLRLFPVQERGSDG